MKDVCRACLGAKKVMGMGYLKDRDCPTCEGSGKNSEVPRGTLKTLNIDEIHDEEHQEEVKSKRKYNKKSSNDE